MVLNIYFVGSPSSWVRVIPMRSEKRLGERIGSIRMDYCNFTVVCFEYNLSIPRASGSQSRGVLLHNHLHAQMYADTSSSSGRRSMHDPVCMWSSSTTADSPLISHTVAFKPLLVARRGLRPQDWQGLCAFEASIKQET